MDALIGRFERWALDLAAALLNDRSLAPDVVQESFLVALEKLSSLREPEAFPGWFRQIIRTQSGRANRTRVERQLEDDLPLASQRPGPREQLHRKRIAERVRIAVESLPARSRQTVDLYYLHEMRHADIARQLDVPLGTVKRRLYDARRTLRTLLIGLEDEDASDCRPEDVRQRFQQTMEREWKDTTK